MQLLAPVARHPAREDGGATVRIDILCTAPAPLAAGSVVLQKLNFPPRDRAVYMVSTVEEAGTHHNHGLAILPLLSQCLNRSAQPLCKHYESRVATAEETLAVIVKARKVQS